MKLKSWLCIFLCLVMVIPVAACGQEEDGNRLTVMVYKGGYGEEWIQVMLEKFAEENEGVFVDPKSSTTFTATLDADIKDKKKNVDIYFSHTITWEKYAVANQIEQLDDLYQTEIEDGKTFEQRLVPEARDSAKYNGHYYKMPWTRGAGGIVYNMDILEKAGWDHVPQTYEELGQYSQDIVDAKLKTASGKDIAPFIWSGKSAYYWDYVVYPWWAQLAGTEKIKDLMTYSKGAETYNPDSNWKELKEAYNYWYELIAKNNAFSTTACEGIDQDTAQSIFVSGEAAMIPNAQWFYNETKIGAPKSLKMELHPAPTLANAKPGFEKVSFQVGFGDSAVIPSVSKNKTLAKKFLAFMAREDNCNLFSQYAVGTALAFDYDFSEVAKDNQFAASVAKMLNESVNFNVFSSAPIAVIHGSEVISPWPNNDYYYRDSYTNPTENTPENVFDTVYDYMQSNWNNLMAGAGLA